jgi:hypothetical protein
MLCKVGSDRIMRDMSWDVSRHTYVVAAALAVVDLFLFVLISDCTASGRG